MQTAEAVELLSGAEWNSRQPSVWADLGCGDGFFTGVLAGMLPGKSRIYALDRQPQNLKKLAGEPVQVVFQQADFIIDDLQLPMLDGILMANSLHYVANKHRFLDKTGAFLKTGGMFIIIEYDTSTSNRWVPFPVDFKTLSELFREKGYSRIEKIGERKSIYHRAGMYACMIQP